jgi:hypothetical protein
MTSTGHSVTTARSRSSATRQVSKERSRCRGRGVRVLRWQRNARPANDSRNSRRGPGRLDRSGRLRQPTAAEGEPPREWFERLYNGRQWTRRAAGEPLIRFQEPRSRLTTNLGSVLGTTARNVQLRARRGRRIGDSFALTLPAGSHTPMMDLRLRPAGPMLEPLTRGMSHASLGALTRVHLPALCRCRMN